MLSDQVVIPCHYDNVHWSGVAAVVQPECVQQGLQGGPGHCHIVNMLGVSFILRGGVAWRSKEVMECGVRDYNFGSEFRIWKVATFAGGALVSLIGLFNPYQPSPPDAGEMLVVNQFLFIWWNLGVRAYLTVAGWRVVAGTGAAVFNRLGP